MKLKSVLTRDDVARILDHARAEAQANKWSVTIAVVDDGGHPLALERLDGAAPVSSYIATEKARTSAMGRRAKNWRSRPTGWSSCRTASTSSAPPG